MDDGFISVHSVREAKQLIREEKKICTKGYLRLNKFVLNFKEFLQAVSENELDCTTKEADLNYDILPMQSVLDGTKTFLEVGAATRRGILSTVASVYDPWGFISPYILAEKRVLQNM